MCDRIEEKPQILFVSSDKFPPFRVDVAVLFGKVLSQRGHKIDYLLQSEDDYHRFDTKKWRGANVFVGPTDNGSTIIRRVLKNGLSLLNDLRMIRIAKKKRYDAIQVKDKFLAAIGAIIISRLIGCKFIFWLSYPFPEADIYAYEIGIARYPMIYLVRGKVVKFLLYKIILPCSDHIFVQSEQMKKEVHAMGIEADKLTPVPMAVDIDEFPNIAPAIEDSETSPTIVYIGEMEKLRQIDIVLKFFKIVRETVPEARLIMVGASSDPNDLEFLKNESKKMMIDDSTLFTGYIPRSQALQYVQKASVCVSPIVPNPIYIPSSPTKLVEYMLLKKPVVANDIPEQLRIIQESKAGYCVQFNEYEFAEAIIALLKNPELAKKMGQKGYEYVKRNRNYHQIADIVERQYAELLG